MNFIENKLYIEDLDYIIGLDLPWEKLKDRRMLISGSTGLIGSFLVDLLMRKNETGLNCTIYALNRNIEKAKRRFCVWSDNKLLRLIPYDINKPFLAEDIDYVDYVLHMASNTHPILYSTDPIGTITTNIIGAQNMLEFAAAHNVTRFAFTSSNEMYGENRGDVERFSEDYCGYINSNTLRAGYPESKRCSEALCQAYRMQKGIDIVIPRITRTYGPTMLMDDSKAIGQFIKKAIAGKDIVLKSSGSQYYSYTYVADAVSGLLYVLLKGLNGEAYNIADETSDITLRDLAETIASFVGVNVTFEDPDFTETAGYSTVTKARLDGTKLKNLGWKAKYNIQTGIERTINILSNS